MALWGSNDNITTFGTVAVSGTTVTGTGTTFTSDVVVGQVIRIGVRGGVGTYYGDAVITGITSDRVLTIDTTDGLSATSIAATSYYISELPKSSVLDSVYQEGRSDADSLVYGTATENEGLYKLGHTGWVGVTTYIDCHGSLRVKTETLVAMSGISTGNIPYPTDE
jgi:hypothetical protein|tara:strand:+ start:453 stop:950 length:498 start_codon:yes stop_codon:yes gene_type:complete